MLKTKTKLGWIPLRIFVQKLKWLKMASLSRLIAFIIVWLALPFEGIRVAVWDVDSWAFFVCARNFQNMSNHTCSIFTNAVVGQHPSVVFLCIPGVRPGPRWMMTLVLGSRIVCKVMRLFSWSSRQTSRKLSWRMWEQVPALSEFHNFQCLFWRTLCWRSFAPIRASATPEWLLAVLIIESDSMCSKAAEKPLLM